MAIVSVVDAIVESICMHVFSGFDVEKKEFFLSDYHMPNSSQDTGKNQRYIGFSTFGQILIFFFVTC